MDGGLKRVLGLGGAILLGLGSIIGTGVFVTLGLAAGQAGAFLPLAILIAALLALINGLALAQLAAAQPVSGATYEYGYRYLNAPLGFTAGWMFVAAKSASAATAALGAIAYLSAVSGPYAEPGWAAAMLVLLVLLLTLFGLRRSNVVNALLVSLTLCVLLLFAIYGLPQALSSPLWQRAEPPEGIAGLLGAAALVFVAFTGYGRIATLGEEVLQPRRTIPRAIVFTLAIAALLYVAVGAAALGLLGATPYAELAEEGRAPLETAARLSAGDWLAQLLRFGAVAAMLGVLLNLILGISRVLLAMGRRGDMPGLLARLDRRSEPGYAQIASAGLIALLALYGSIKLAWSLSAFTVLVYYSITNLAALRQPPSERLYPRALFVCGLLACLSLAAFIEWRYVLPGLALIAAGLVWHFGAALLRRRD